MSELFTLPVFDIQSMLRGLDDVKGLSRVDLGNMLGAVNRFPGYLAESARAARVKAGNPRAFQSIVMVGIGGSGSAADVLSEWLGPRVRIPFFVVRDSVLPKFVGRDSLVVAISYSGGTWETLDVFRTAVKRGCALAGVGSGGRLAELCVGARVPFVRVPQNILPRAALGPMVGASAVLFEGFGIVKGVRASLQEAGQELAQLQGLLRAEVPSSRNAAKRLALGLRGKLPVVYSLQRMSSVGRRAKNQFAENSKVVAKYDVLPEAGHNEIVAWQGRRAGMVPVIVRDLGESRKERAVIEAFKTALVGVAGRKPLEVRTRATSELGRLLGPILFFDYVSVYLACLMGVDPSATEGIQLYRRFFSLRMRG